MKIDTVSSKHLLLFGSFLYPTITILIGGQQAFLGTGIIVYLETQNLMGGFDDSGDSRNQECTGIVVHLEIGNLLGWVE